MVTGIGMGTVIGAGAIGIRADITTIAAGNGDIDGGDNDDNNGGGDGADDVSEANVARGRATVTKK
ncbi:hypothetical protein PQR02_38890 [Paraburkholderia sediminicola]|uniref:Uncharacterized protein n=1 Tax=Paraburkholderia rhynchosiae TaxID=487049 RepID=A0ACC7NPJ0_9BURK